VLNEKGDMGVSEYINLNDIFSTEIIKRKQKCKCYNRDKVKALELFVSFDTEITIIKIFINDGRIYYRIIGLKNNDSNFECEYLKNNSMFSGAMTEDYIDAMDSIFGFRCRECYN
jgi:hypothetical protein